MFSRLLFSDHKTNFFSHNDRNPESKAVYHHYPLLYILISKIANKSSLGSLMLRMEQCRLTYPTKHLKPSRRSSTGSSLSSLSEQEPARDISRTSTPCSSISSISRRDKPSRLLSRKSVPHSSLSSLSLPDGSINHSAMPGLSEALRGRQTRVVTHTSKLEQEQGGRKVISFFPRGVCRLCQTFV